MGGAVELECWRHGPVTPPTHLDHVTFSSSTFCRSLTDRSERLWKLTDELAGGGNLSETKFVRFITARGRPSLGAVEVLIGFSRRACSGPAVLLELVISQVFLRLSW